MVKHSRKFNGKRYSLGPYGFRTKSKAKKEARKARKVGTKVRVVYTGKKGKWGLYKKA